MILWLLRFWLWGVEWGVMGEGMVWFVGFASIIWMELLGWKCKFGQRRIFFKFSISFDKVVI